MTCKLYLVPEDVINNWRSEHREKAVDQPVCSVTAQIYSKLSSSLKSDMTDYDKEKLYAQELEKLRTLRHQKAPSLPFNSSSCSNSSSPYHCQTFLKCIKEKQRVCLIISNQQKMYPGMIEDSLELAIDS